MPSWLDIALVLASVLAAVGYFVWGAVRRRRKGLGCCSTGCGFARNPGEQQVSKRLPPRR